jgi:hypothetical protein
MLRAHPDFWDWDALSRNENLSWSASLLHEHAHKWDWAALSANEAIPFSGDLIERHHRRWDWELLSVNEALPWTEDLIRRFSGQWPWGLAQDDASDFGFKGALSMNRALPWSAELLNEFKHRWDWRILSGNPVLPWSPDLLHRFREQWAWGVEPSNKELLYPTLSTNPGVSWTERLLTEYSALLNWTELSRNPSLPWTETFLERHQERWDWQVLSANEGLPWDRELLRAHENQWDWGRVAGNEGVSWTETLFDQVWDKIGGGHEGRWFGGNRVVPWNEDLTSRVVQKCWCYKTQHLTHPSLVSGSQFDRWETLLRRETTERHGKKQWVGPVSMNGYACWEINPSLLWSPELLKRITRTKFQVTSPKWKGIAMNRGLPWSAALLLQFDAKFFPDHQSVLVDNDQVWHRAFAPAVTEGVLQRLVREA